MLDGGGWLGMVRRKLQFSSGAAAGVDHYDRQIALADVTLCLVGLMVVKVMNGYNVGHIATAKTVYSLRRAWKMYQQCYASVLDVYRAVYDLDPGQQVNHDFYSIYLPIPRLFIYLVADNRATCTQQHPFGETSFTSICFYFVVCIRRKRSEVASGFETQTILVCRLVGFDVERGKSYVSLGYHIV